MNCGTENLDAGSDPAGDTISRGMKISCSSTQKWKEFNAASKIFHYQ
jgi:hypothetical protein